MPEDTTVIAAAMALYAAAAVVAVLTAARRRPSSFSVAMTVLGVALATHTVAIGLRWMRLDHGPYVDMYEVLSSNVWSLHVAILGACLLIPRIRPILAVALPLLQIMVVWLLSVTPSDAPAPVTYDTSWLAVHVWLGKVFLGSVAVAVGLSLVVLARNSRLAGTFHLMPPVRALDELAYRFVLVAFVFESLMLVAGAIWARDAWGRYWAWDPLETWAFITWVAVAGFLHLRVTKRPSPALSAVLVIGLFALAFSTLFGMPFVTTAPHKGAV